DEELLAVDLDLGTRVFAEQHLVADLDVERRHLAVVTDLALAGGDDLALLGLLLRRVGDVEAALRLLEVLLEPLDEDAVLQWPDLHSSRLLSRCSGLKPAKIIRDGPRVKDLARSPGFKFGARTADMTSVGSRRTLVVGGAGFVGHHLVPRLLEADRDVVVIANLSGGSMARFGSHLGDPRLPVVRGDVTDTVLVRAIVAEIQPAVVYHLAALHFLPYCAAHPSETLLVNVVGTQLLLDALG